MSVQDELKQPPDSPSSEDAAVAVATATAAACCDDSQPATAAIHADATPTPATPKFPELLGCDEHPHGRPAQSRECPKCDTVLSSARSLGGHMTMSHSRNACKALKCPKCNWSYKYQETLEIHMKEKHPETNSQCVYCASCQPHPRLARGESYSCGYKPYRCEICNYSTTTKGNLSIHMQSDKHINNVQELQNSAAVAAALAAAASINGQPSSPAPAAPSAPLLKSCATCAKTPCECPKQGPPQTSSGPELLPTTASASASAAAVCQQSEELDKRAAGKPKPVSRCDVCKYETTVPRNLRIHMTSEKHLHNVAIQQAQPSSQPCSKTDTKSEPEPAPTPARAAEPARADAPSSAALQELLAQLAQTRSALPSGMPNLSLSPSLLPLLGMNGLSGLNAAATAALMMNSFGVANLGSFPLAAQSGSVWADLLTQGSTAQVGSSSAADWLRLHAAAAVLSAAYNNQTGSNSSSAASGAAAPAQGPLASPSAPAKPCDAPKERRSAPNSQKLYHCSICNVFSSESLEELQEHIQLDRTSAKQQTAGAVLQYDPETVQIASGTFMCKLCTYKTTLKANFQLHCKTDKHLQRVQLVNHIKEGGAQNDWRLQALLNSAVGGASGSIAAQTTLSNLIQVRCVACDCCTNLLHKLQIHSQTPQHHFNARLFHYLADCEASLHALPGRKLAYHCALCPTCECSRTALIAHANSPEHARQLALRSGCASLNDAELLQQNSKFIDLFRVDYDDGGANAPDSQLLLQASTYALCSIS